VVLDALALDISSSTVEYVADWSQGSAGASGRRRIVHRVATAVLADLDQTDPHETVA
jgi:hypothetical protein